MKGRSPAGENVRFGLVLALPLLLLVPNGCNVPEPPVPMGGVHLTDEGVTPFGDPCPRALAVVNSDYTSSNLSILSATGDLLSESLLASSSSGVGSNAALSGDVVLPIATPTSGRLVLIDRYPNSVLTWIDPATAVVTGQLSVATGFASNPHDYIELDDTRAYVSRYETNPNPGKVTFDEGGDLLVIDTRSHTIRSRIRLPTSDDGLLLPRPDRMLRVKDQVWVTLQRFDASFRSVGTGAIVGINVHTDSATWSIDLPGVTGCSTMALSPSATRVAVTCSGSFGNLSSQLAQSAVVVLDATKMPPSVVERYGASEKANAPFGPSIAFASEATVFGTTYGDLDVERKDTVIAIDRDRSNIETLARANSAFVFGDVRCAPGCSNLCFVTDAERGVLRSWRFEGDHFEPWVISKTDRRIALPPRYLGGL